MDSFENFEQQERSWAHLQGLGPALAWEAVEVLLQHPDWQSGLVTLLFP